MTFWKWSQTAASNATADSTINWAEGQSPSSVNDSARAMMAAAAKYRDDGAGAIVAGGTSTALTVTSYEVFDTLAHLDGKLIAFTANVTNGATVTLNVDGLGAKPLRFWPSSDELPAGTLIAGTTYVALYNNANGEFYLQNMAPDIYVIPLGGLIPYLGTSAPNSRFALPFGQAISRTTYATLFSLVSTTYGVGDGSTTFNIPDLRGRVPAGLDNMGGSAANRLTNAGSGITGTTNGATGGAETVTLTTAQLPAHNHPVTDPGHTHTVPSTPILQGASAAATGIGGGGTTTTSSATTGITVGNTGSGNAVNNAQPTIVLPYILRVL
jgi:microcystin-dependent protein